MPALPRRLTQPTPVVVAGTLLWLLAALWFGVADWGAWDVRFWTSLAGFGLGLIGFGLFRWQRSASRRGSRGAWKGLSGLD